MPKTSLVEQSSIEKARKNRGRITVLAATVSLYSRLEPLPGAARDLELIKGLFLNDKERTIYGRSRFTALENPTVEEVRNAILSYAHTRSAHGDILIFYFSGHGCVTSTNSFGFCLADTIMGMKEGVILPLSVLSFRDVVQTLSAVDVHPVFIIDACFSGATARTFIPTIGALMQDELHTHVAGSYGLLCSSNTDVLSIDTEDGGAFTKAIYSIVAEGLSDDRQRHWPFLTLRGIALPLQERLAREGYPLSRCYLGPDLPEIPIARNVKFRPHSEYFAPYLRRTIEFAWNNGSPREVTVTELRNRIGTGAYANHSKLSLPPWGLLEDGQRTGTRKLTKKGKRFAQGKTRIPERIMKDPVSWEWVVAPDTKRVLITDIS